MTKRMCLFELGKKENKVIAEALLKGDKSVVWIGGNIQLGEKTRIKKSDWSLDVHKKVSILCKTRKMGLREAARESNAEYKAEVQANAKLMKKLESLRGKVLVCTCPQNVPCHGDILIELLEETRDRASN